jgi:group II intron reverse transcriptase/maturase
VAKIKAHSLTGRITPELVYHAFRNVKRNRGAAGIDKVSITLFANNLLDNVLALTRRLKDGTFRPLPLRRVHIPKGDGKTRPLGIPAVRDRVAQEVLRQLLSPLFERIFHDDSYGFRPHRGCHQAVTRVLELQRQGYTQVLDADIKGFFDNIPHTVIMAGVAAEVADGNILRLVERFLKAGVMEEGVFRPTAVGTPQGFRTLDRWIRMRIRCMKFKQKRLTDNWRLCRKHLANLGFVFLTAARAPPAVETLRRPTGATAMASPGA